MYNDVHFVNLSMVSDVTTVREAPTNNSRSFDPPTLNVSRLNTRLTINVDRKKLNAKAFKAGVSPEGHKAFAHISKT